MTDKPNATAFIEDVLLPEMNRGLKKNDPKPPIDLCNTGRYWALFELKQFIQYRSNMDKVERATLRFLQAIKDSGQLPILAKNGLEMLHTVSWGTPKIMKTFKIVITEEQPK